MPIALDLIRCSGKERVVPTLNVLDKHRVVVPTALIRTAYIDDDWRCDVDDPEYIIAALKRSRIRADILTFSQRLPDTTPRFTYPLEWNNVAAIKLKDYDFWWKHQITQEARNKVRRSLKKGVVTKEVPFDDDLVYGISSIYNETPLRQGKPFWHYNKAIDSIRDMSATYLNISTFVGAYYEMDLIGFVKLVDAGPFVRTFHIISKIAHSDKSPTNALIAKSVEICCSRQKAFLVYGQYDYGKLGSEGLTRFKRDNGFERIALPKYYVPITAAGRIAIGIGIHHGISNLLPTPLVRKLLFLRDKYYTWRLNSK